MTAALTLPAPAKINLYLHVTGKRADGYHLLDSLIAFANVGDRIGIAPADGFHLSIEGPFAGQLSSDGNNIVARAAWAYCAQIGVSPDLHITLTKNLPVGSGIGGGSADAAATLRGLQIFYECQVVLDNLLISLGADVPACYHSMPLRIRGIGEEIEPVTMPFEVPALLVNPLKFCATPAVFKALPSVSEKQIMPIPDLSNKDALYRFLNSTQNDLTDAAISQVPEIADVLAALKNTHPRFVRMSGSGATCFALYETAGQCEKAAHAVRAAHADWWIEAGSLTSSSTP